MKNFLNWIAIVLISLAAIACNTEDVGPNDPNPPKPTDLYRISDLAFAEYLAYNSTLKATDANYLPEGSVVKKDGEYYIDKAVAATATAMVYLVKDETRMSNLEKAGVATARVKIVNIDGIQFFTQIKEVRLTSNAIIGGLDLSMLTKLETLEMNGNFVNSLTIPSSIKRLRYSASTVADAPDNRWLTSIDLSKCSSLVHVFLPNHHIEANGLKLPSVYADWKDLIDFSGNPGAPFPIPEELYNQFSATNRLGVTVGNPSGYDGPEPAQNYFEIPDLAFAEYLFYNTTLPTTDANYLTTGSVIKYKNDKHYIDKAIAATATGIVYVVKTNAAIAALPIDRVPTASVKIKDISGIEFFTNIKELKLTSNNITGALNLSSLTKLENLEMNFNTVNSLIVPPSIKKVTYKVSNPGGLITSINLANCSALEELYLNNQSINTAGIVLPSSYANLVIIDLSGNPGAPFEISSDLFAQLNTSKSAGVIANDPPQPENPDTAPDKFFEIPDLAFAEYLYYNTTLAETDANYLLVGSVIQYNNKYYVNKAVAATATGIVYAAKSANAIALLPIDRVPTASVKIKNISGIEYFNNIRGLTLTSNELTGSLDFSTFTKLETLEMNSNFVNVLKVPASLVKLSYNASTSSSAPSNRWLTAIDLSACSNLTDISLINHKITTEGLKLPTSYTNLKNIDLTGNTGAPFAIPSALYNQLTKKNGVSPQ